ncbi:guanylate kinase [Planomonospora corallina]|uniref:Guanylate kinase n=1 Tax=Planomonospora corallina TaxID=1806052 RepID=A0ABV8IGQ6_9ACTN
MSPYGIVLYGPPASGKDTITAALNRLDPQVVLLPKLKVGTGRPDGYEFVTAEHLDRLRAEGRLLVETRRYGNVYAVDRRTVADRQAAGYVSVVHMGNIPDLRTLMDRTPDSWLRVLLWVPREVTAQRSKARGDADTDQRLAAWDETLADLEAHADAGFFHLRIHTDRLSPDAAARQIMEAYGRLRAAGRPHAEECPR